MFDESPELAVQLLEGFSSPAALTKVDLQMDNFVLDFFGDMLLVKASYEAWIAFDERYDLRLAGALELKNPPANEVLAINSDTLKLAQELLEQNKFTMFFDEMDFHVFDSVLENKSLFSEIDNALNACCYMKMRKELERLSDEVMGVVEKNPCADNSKGFSSEVMSSMINEIKRLIVKNMRQLASSEIAAY